MVQHKKPQPEGGTSAARRESSMSYSKKDAAGPISGRGDGRAAAQNGSRGFRTDSVIANARLNERALTPWSAPTTADTSASDMDVVLEKPAGNGEAWDQFKVNEQKFGLTTDYNEDIYTTPIDRSHPDYKDRVIAAERKAREIELSAPATTHVAEERVMDGQGAGQDGDVDEEDKYSGVRRQDFPPLAGRENKYTPPAKRAPSGQATVPGVPVDPAIISSQIKGTLAKKATAGPLGPSKLQQQLATTAGPAEPNNNKPSDAKPALVRPAGSYAAAVRPTEKGPAAAKNLARPEPSVRPAEAAAAAGSGPKPPVAAPPAGPGEIRDRHEIRVVTPLRPILPQGRMQPQQPPQPEPQQQLPPQPMMQPLQPQQLQQHPVSKDATSTVERDVLNSFKNFANQQRESYDKVRTNKAKADKQVRLAELRKFADSFKLSTPVPSDLIGIIAKNPEKQKEIQEKALRNAEEMARAKDAIAREEAAASDAATTEQVLKAASAILAKAAAASAASGAMAGPGPGSVPVTSPPSGIGLTPAVVVDPKVVPRPMPGGPHIGHSGGMQNRHPGSRQPYGPGGYHQQPYRADRSSQHMPQHQQQQQQHHHPHHQQQQQPPPPSRSSLSTRLRIHESQKLAQPLPIAHQPPHTMSPDLRPPTGPALMDPSFGAGRGRMVSNLGHLAAAKLNPNSDEFRPNVFMVPFSPNGQHAHASLGSSHTTLHSQQQQQQQHHHHHHSGSAPALPGVGVGFGVVLAGGNMGTAANGAAGEQPPQAVAQVQLIRRKTQAVDPKKCLILTRIQALVTPVGRNWDDNDGLRPCYDTLPTWRQLQDDEEKSDSTMHRTYKEHLLRQPFAPASVAATPNTMPSMPQVSLQHQQHQQHHQQQQPPPLPFHLQQSAAQQQQQQQHVLAPRQSPHVQAMQPHGGPQHGPPPPPPYMAHTFGPDDHRMAPSNSAQSFTSPRLVQVPVAYTPTMPSPGVPYSQPAMAQYASPAGQALGNFRGYGGGGGGPHQQQQYLPPGHGGGGPSPMMMQQQPYGHGHQTMAPPPILYTGIISQYGVPQPGGGGGGGGPLQSAAPAPNGYPGASPGRPQPPMMTPQGSQQGQIYGMSPNLQYQLPSFAPPAAGVQMSMRGYSMGGPQNFGSSQGHIHHHYGSQYRAGSANGGGAAYAGKNYSNHNGHGGHGGHGGHNVHNVHNGHVPQQQPPPPSQQQQPPQTQATSAQPQQSQQQPPPQPMLHPAHNNPSEAASSHGVATPEDHEDAK